MTDSDVQGGACALSTDLLMGSTRCCSGMVYGTDGGLVDLRGVL